MPHAADHHRPQDIYKRTLVQVLQWGAERQTHEVVARGVEEVAAVRGVDVEEDAGDDDRLLLQELLEEREAVVQRSGKALEVEPDVERRNGWDVDLEPELLEALQHVVALVLEVLLKRDLLQENALRVEERDGGELEAVSEEVSCSAERIKEALCSYGWLAPPSRKEPD